MMVRPLKMQKIRIAAVKSITNPLLQDLHNLGMVEIRRMSTDKFQTGKTIPTYDQVSEQWVRLRAIKSALGLQGGAYREMGVDEAIREAEKINIEGEVRDAQERIGDLATELASLEAKLRNAKKLAAFGNIDLSAASSNYISIYAGTVPAQKAPQLRKALRTCEVSIRQGKMDATALVLCKKDEGESGNVELTLSKFGFNPIDISGFTTPSATIRALEGQLSSKKAEMAEAKRAIAELSSKYGESIKTLERTLGAWAERTLATKDFGFGPETLLLEGWVKAKDYEVLERHLDAKFPDKAYLERIEGKNPPTVLENPKASTQFQFLVELFSLPKSNEIDPTLILMISVPIMYGMIIGDVIYGIISFLLMGWVLKKVKPGGLGHEIARVWRFSALSGIVFGLIFDEWMGMSSYHWLEIFQSWGLLNLSALGITGPLYHGFSRIHNVSLLLGLSIVLGMVHLSFGFLLGAINEWHHSKRHAYGKLAWIGVIMGGFFLVSHMMFGMFPEAVVPAGAAIFAVSLAVMIWAEGMMGAIELPGVLGNCLSYTRIAAVGIAGVVLAELINDTFVPAPEQGLMAFVFLPILITLHILNTGLAMVEGILQGGRLNLVEFYSKFFRGGGKAFVPFSVQKYRQ